MAVELSVAKGSLKVTADELGITPQILTRWCRERMVAPSTPALSRAQVSQEQQEIVRLKKESLRRPGLIEEFSMPVIALLGC